MPSRSARFGGHGGGHKRRHPRAALFACCLMSQASARLTGRAVRRIVSPFGLSFQGQKKRETARPVSLLPRRRSDGAPADGRSPKGRALRTLALLEEEKKRRPKMGEAVGKISGCRGRTPRVHFATMAGCPCWVTYRDRWPARRNLNISGKVEDRGSGVKG